MAEEAEMTRAAFVGRTNSRFTDDAEQDLPADMPRTPFRLRLPSPRPLRIIPLLLLGSLAAAACAADDAEDQAALEPNPTVDYRVPINAVAAAVPEDERAWPLYRQALLRLQGTSERVKAFYDEISWTTQATPQSDIAQFLERHQDALKTVRKAAERQGLGFVVGYDLSPEDLELWPELSDDQTTNELGEGALLNVGLPHLICFRQLGRLFVLDLRQAAAHGDGPTVVADTRTLLGMAKHAREHPIAISDLVAISLAHFAGDCVLHTLQFHPEALSDRQLRSLARLFDEPDDTFRIRFVGERLAFQDNVQRVYTDDGDGDGRLTTEGFRALRRFVADFSDEPADDSPEAKLADRIVDSQLVRAAASRRETIEQCDRLFDIAEAESRQPLWEWGESVVDRQLTAWSESPTDRIRYFMLLTFMPALSRPNLQTQYWLGGRDGLLVTIALHRYRRTHGTWPSSLDHLVPRYLDSVRPDRFDGKPLRYTLIDGQPVVYSLGGDRDDDGGRPAIAAETGEAESDAARNWIPPTELEQRVSEGDLPDGDWILWPPAIESPPRGQ